jgi:hypothetical protein
MGNQFYYTDDSNVPQGPCTTLRLMALHKSGVLTDTSLVCAEGSEEWVELWTIFPSARISKLNRFFSKTSTKTGDASADPDSPTSSLGNATADHRSPLPATRFQAAIIIILLLIALGFPYLGLLRPIPRWEYKKVTFPSESNERVGSGALRYSTISVDEPLLDLMGREGWEMTGSYLEMETAFPNFGDEDAVDGIQPNIRPQSLVVLFKRPL